MDNNKVGIILLVIIVIMIIYVFYEMFKSSNCYKSKSYVNNEGFNTLRAKLNGKNNNTPIVNNDITGLPGTYNNRYNNNIKIRNDINQLQTDRIRERNFDLSNLIKNTSQETLSPPLTVVPYPLTNEDIDTDVTILPVLDDNNYMPNNLGTCISNLNDYKAMFASYDNEKNVASNELKQYRNTIATQDATINNLKSKFAALQNNLLTYRERLSTAEEQVGTAKSAYETVNNNLAICSNNLQTTKEQLTDNLGRYNSLIANYGTCNAKITAMQDRVRTELENYNRCNRNVVAVEEQLANATTTIMGWKARYNDAIIKFNELRNKFNQRINQDKNQQSISEDEINNLYNEIAVLENKIAALNTSDRIKISKAIYRTNNSNAVIDVTDQIRSLCDNKSTCDIMITNDDFGLQNDSADPNILDVEWSCKGQKLVTSANQDSYMRLVC